MFYFPGTRSLTARAEAMETHSGRRRRRRWPWVLLVFAAVAWSLLG